MKASSFPQMIARFIHLIGLDESEKKGLTCNQVTHRPLWLANGMPSQLRHATATAQFREALQRKREELREASQATARLSGHSTRTQLQSYVDCL